MSWPGGTNRAKHPSSTLYSPQGVPQYPPGTTCKALSEQDPYFPVTWHLYLLTLVVVLLYIVWPLYVLRHLCRKKSIWGDHDIYEANHEKFKYGEKSNQNVGDERDE